MLNGKYPKERTNEESGEGERRQQKLDDRCTDELSVINAPVGEESSPEFNVQSDCQNESVYKRNVQFSFYFLFLFTEEKREKKQLCDVRE